MWQENSACRGSDPAIFFPDHYRPESVAKAKAICAGCLVRNECLAWSLEQRERHGVWGGLTPEERGATSWRVCKWCEDMFSYDAKPGQPKAYCSDRCRSLSRQVIKERSYEKHHPNAWAQYEQGHGRISRYQAGCRCVACRKASREYRARYARSA